MSSQTKTKWSVRRYVSPMGGSFHNVSVHQTFVRCKYLTILSASYTLIKLENNVRSCLRPWDGHRVLRQPG